jgi:nitrate/nitrite transporter NarK
LAVGPADLAAAAVIVVAAVAAIVVTAIAAAVAEQEQQDNDPPPVVAAEPVAHVAVVTTHKNTSKLGFGKRFAYIPMVFRGGIFVRKKLS